MSVDHEKMTRCLMTEIKTIIENSWINNVTSIYFGGGESLSHSIVFCDTGYHMFQLICTGTPSLMKPSTVESVIGAVASCAHLNSDAEINIEANPTSVEIKKLRYV